MNLIFTFEMGFKRVTNDWVSSSVKMYEGAAEIELQLFLHHVVKVIGFIIHTVWIF